MTIAISMVFLGVPRVVADAGAVRARCCGPSISRKTASSSCSTAVTTSAQNSYLRSVKFSLRHKTLVAGGLRACCSSPAGSCSAQVPGSFVPDEDQGYTIGIVQMPPGSTIQRTREVMRRVSEKLRTIAIGGFGIRSHGLQLQRQRRERRHLLHPLKDIEDRKETAAEFIDWAFGRTFEHGTRRHGVFFVNLPMIPGLGQFRRLRILARGSQATGHGRRCIGARTCWCRRPRKSPVVQGVRRNGLPPSPQLEAHARSRAGAVDGARDRRRLQRRSSSCSRRCTSTTSYSKAACCA